MRITLTCVWQPGQDPDTDKPFVAFRSDRLHDRTLWPDELAGFLRRHQPEWRELRIMGWEPTPIVYTTEIDLDTPVLCRSCNLSLPVEYIDNNFICSTCANLPVDVRQGMIDNNRVNFPEE